MFWGRLSLPAAGPQRIHVWLEDATCGATVGRVSLYWTAHKGGSWGHSAPGVGAYVADLDGPPVFSTKSCDSWEFCTTKHPHRKGVIFDQPPSLEGVNLRPNTLTTYK